MPAPKRSSSAGRKSSSTAKPAAKRAGSAGSQTRSAARSGAKSTATSTRKAAARTATQAKSGATKTSNAAKSGAAKTRRSSRTGGAGSTARAAGSGAASTAKTARSGARGTATTARAGAGQVKSTGKAAATRTRRASGSEGVASVAEQLSRGAVKPRDLVMLTRDRIQETLDDAASRGRVTRKDANELVSELVRRALQQSDDLMHELEQLLDRGRGQLESATKLARKSDSVDRLVRGADRARRTVGVGPTFPILGYDDLNGGQIQSRLSDLSKPELRKVLTYERNHANRKTVIAALERAIG